MPDFNQTWLHCNTSRDDWKVGEGTAKVALSGGSSQETHREQTGRSDCHAVHGPDALLPSKLGIHYPCCSKWGNPDGVTFRFYPMCQSAIPSVFTLTGIEIDTQWRFVASFDANYASTISVMELTFALLSSCYLSYVPIAFWRRPSAFEKSRTEILYNLAVLVFLLKQQACHQESLRVWKDLSKPVIACNPTLKDGIQRFEYSQSRQLSRHSTRKRPGSSSM